MKLMEALRDGIVITMPEDGILRVRRTGEKNWTEIRGRWDATSMNDPFQQALAALPGPQVSPLYADDEMFISKERFPQAYQYFDTILRNE